MVRHFCTLSLRGQLAYLVLATAMPLLLAGLLMYMRLSENEQEKRRLSLMIGARTLAGLVDNELDTYAAIASTLSNSEALKVGNFEGFGNEARRSLGSVAGTWLVVFSPGGEMLYSTSEHLAAESVLLPQDLIGKTIASPRPLVSDLVSVSTAAVVLVSVAVHRENRPSYVLAISVSPSRFVDIIKDRVGSEQRVAVVDTTHRIVARIPGHELRLGTPIAKQWRNAVERQRSGIANTLTQEGVDTLTAYFETSYGWVVGVAETRESIAQPFRSVLTTTLGISLVLVLTSLAFSTAFARYMGNGMTELARAARAIGKGEAIKSGSPPFLEAQTIHAALQAASAEIVRRDELLSQANAELEGKVAARTEELRAEMERREASEARVRQMEKMEAIGRLSGGIAHDFNNMLAIILSSLGLVERKLGRGETDVGRFLEAARQGTERAASLTQRLLVFARSQPLHSHPTDVNRLITGMSELLSRTMPANVTIETVLEAKLWTVNVDANQLEISLLNLAANARDAMPAGGKLRIETQNAVIGETTGPLHAAVKPGQYVIIAATDTGGGMPDDVVARAFEPFFTTKPSGQGTGLGLTQVYGFLKQSGGHVEIQNKAGHGVTVFICLPRHLGTAIEPKDVAAAHAAYPAPCEETLVLVVEDDPTVLRGTVGLLQELGYRTLEAASGEEALARLHASPGVRLLLTDVVMPGMNGRELADRALRAFPDLKVVFTSGYTSDALVRNGSVEPDLELIGKPFTLDVLARTLHRVLRPSDATEAF